MEKKQHVTLERKQKRTSWIVIKECFVKFLLLPFIVDLLSIVARKEKRY